jgi:serine/threonine protein kinase
MIMEKYHDVSKDRISEVLGTDDFVGNGGISYVFRKGDKVWKATQISNNQILAITGQLEAKYSKDTKGDVNGVFVNNVHLRLNDEELRQLRFSTTDESALHRLSECPNVPNSYGLTSWAIDGYYFTVLEMDLIQGHSVRHLIDNDLLSQEQGYNLIYQTAITVKEAHAKKIVHGDLKPANLIQSSKSNKLYVADWANASLPPEENTERDHFNNQTGILKEVIGTAAYMSPENIKGEKLLPASDIWSIGATAYEILLGIKIPAYAEQTRVLEAQGLDPVMHRLSKIVQYRFEDQEEIFENLLTGEINLQVTLALKNALDRRRDVRSLDQIIQATGNL